MNKVEAFDRPVVYVDIETTGGSYRTGRILEVAVIRYENDTVQEFSTLLNPKTYIPAQITRMTGITARDVHDAPSFEAVAFELYELMKGAVFIAHNVRFDYSFLKHEFERVGLTFSPVLLCTVRLSRALYPHARSHSLASLIERHAIPVEQRHRALADARAMRQFTQIALTEHGSEQFAAAVSRQLKTQSLPPNLDLEEIEHIGDVPGVYIFKDEHCLPLYVGKSVALRRRILSHFRDPSAREVKMNQQIHHVEVHRTGSELAALVMESKLVKELQPLFNRRLRRKKQYAILFREEADGYATLQVTVSAPTPEIDFSKVYGVYPTRMKAKQRIDELTRSFELCPKLMGLEKATGACFAYRLGRCRGACIGSEAAELYNRRFEVALEHHKIGHWPYRRSVTVPVNEEGDTVVIDNWIIRGFLKSGDSPLMETAEPTFDLDEYKIIRQFLRANAHLIRPEGAK